MVAASSLQRRLSAGAQAGTCLQEAGACADPAAEEYYGAGAAARERASRRRLAGAGGSRDLAAAAAMAAAAAAADTPRARRDGRGADEQPAGGGLSARSSRRWGPGSPSRRARALASPPCMPGDHMQALSDVPARFLAVLAHCQDV